MADPGDLTLSISNKMEELAVSMTSVIGAKEETQKPELFHYSPIVEPGTIRLLLLHPGVNEDPLTGSLHQVKLDEAIYEALSYCWGDPTMDCALELDGCRLNITESLNGALKRLRLEDQARYIWADAICINQKDLKEKSKQIVLMPEIYTSAARVLVYLGEPADDSDDAMELIDKLAKADLRHASAVSISSYLLRAVRLPQKTNPAWAALLKFWLRPWFSRIWVVQEVTLGREIIFICGKSELDWQPLNVATDKMTKLGLLTDFFESVEDPSVLMDAEYAVGNVSFMLKLRARRRPGTAIFELFRSFVDSHEGWTDIIHYMGLSPEMQVIFQVYRENPHLLPIFEGLLREKLGTALEQLEPSSHGILELLRMTFQCESTDPRDRIYALLGISKDINQDNFHPNYDEPAEKVALRLSRLLVEQGQGIMLLYHGWMEPSTPSSSVQNKNWDNVRPRTRISIGVGHNGTSKGFPTWTPNWTKPNSTTSMMIAGGGIEDLYQAATKAEPELTLGDDDILRTSGYYLADCDYLEETELSEYTIDWPAYFAKIDRFICADGDAYLNGESWSEVRWRLLCANKNLQPSQAPPEFAAQYSHFREVMEETRFSGDYSPEQLEKIVDMLARNMWLKCFKNYTIGFKPARTREGYLGLVPRATETTDQICFVKGANMPFVFRPTEERESRYKLVGPCYVHGLMNGEALDLNLKVSEILIE